MSMSKNKQRELFDKFPLLYRAVNARDSSNRPKTLLAERGIECEDGWYQLLAALSSKIADLCIGFKEDKYPRVEQVKEKFGGLRFYISFTGTPEDVRNSIHALVDTFEQHSLETCEICGNPGKLRDDRRWIRTLCDNHNEELKEQPLETGIPKPSC